MPPSFLYLNYFYLEKLNVNIFIFLIEINYGTFARGNTFT